MALEPGGLVGGDGEGVGVGFGEHVVPVDLAEDLRRRILRDAVRRGALEEAPAVHLDQVLGVGLGEGPPDLVGLGGGHARDVHDELDDLLLPDDDPVAPFEGALFQGVVVLPRRAVPVTLDELGDGAALHADAGPDEGDLVGEVEKVAGAQPPRQLELGGRLQQEDALRSAGADHLIDGVFLRVDLAQVGPLPPAPFDEVEGFLHLVEYRQGEQVDLGEAGVGDAVLVPVHDVAAVDGPGPHGYHLRDG